MRKPILISVLVVVAVALTTAWVVRQELQEEREGLLQRATVSADQARTTALAAHPGARVKESEIEEEDGRLIYSFDLEVPGGDGSVEVEIDAMTGVVLPAEPDSDVDDDDADGQLESRGS